MVQIFKLLSFAALSQAAVLHARATAADVLDLMKQADAATKNFTQAVKAYKNGTLSDDYYYNVESPYSLADSSSRYPHATPFYKAGARKLCNYMNTTLAADTRKLTNALIAKKNAFVTNNQTDNVNNWAQQIQFNSVNAAEDIGNNSPASVNAPCFAAENRFNDYWNQVLATYGGSSLDGGN